MLNKLPKKCPSCKNNLIVKSLECSQCGTEVQGDFGLPTLTLLDEDEQSFILKFIKYSGSLKKMAKDMKLSYPTVRNILNDIINKIDEIEHKNNQEGKKDG